MARFRPEDIERARRLLGLPWEASLQDLKRAYRAGCRRLHPDHGGSAEAFRELHQAYRLLLEYMQSYRCSLRPEEVRRQDPDRPLERFLEDWMWGGSG